MHCRGAGSGTIAKILEILILLYNTVVFLFAASTLVLYIYIYIYIYMYIQLNRYMEIGDIVKKKSISFYIFIYNLVIIYYWN